MLDFHEIAFLKAALRAGLTFSKIALNAHDDHRIVLNRLRARKVYDKVRPLMDKVPRTGPDFTTINDRFAMLKANLQQLGGMVRD